MEEELEVHVEVEVDWRDGCRGCGVSREEEGDLGWDLRVLLEGVVVEDDEDDPRPLPLPLPLPLPPGEGGRMGETRMPESALATAGS